MKKLRLRISIIAIVFILLLSGCGMSAEKQAEMNKNTLDELANKEVGEEVRFGSFNNHAISWTVVATENNAYLLVSKDTVVDKAYNDDGGSINVDDPKYHANEWSKCSLRQWLNNDFYNEAFEETAQTSIITTKVSNSFKEEYQKSGGANTDDKVFILSFAEAKKYLESLNIVEVGKKTYWLRNPSGTNGCYAGTCDGRLSGEFMYQDNDEISNLHGVRIAVWVSPEEIDDINFNTGAVHEDTNDYSDHGSSGSSSKRTCPNCNGTGMTKTYSTNDPLEEPTYIECPMCRGTGKVSD